MGVPAPGEELAEERDVGEDWDLLEVAYLLVLDKAADDDLLAVLHPYGGLLLARADLGIAGAVHGKEARHAGDLRIEGEGDLAVSRYVDRDLKIDADALLLL